MRAIIKHNWCSYQKGKFGHRDIEELREITHEEEDHPQAKERGLEYILFSRPSEGTTQSLEFQHSSLSNSGSQPS